MIKIEKKFCYILFFYYFCNRFNETTRQKYKNYFN